MLVLFQKFINYLDGYSLLIVSSPVHLTYSITSLKWVTEKYSILFLLLILCDLKLQSVSALSKTHTDGFAALLWGIRKDAVA